jgi:hypothetical protein
MTKDSKPEEKTHQTFANVLAVFEYLKKAGWKIGKSLVYEHRKSGMLRPSKDGLFHLADVERYIAIAQLENINNPTGKLEKFAEEKARIELEREKEKLAYDKHKNKLARGMFVPREAFEQELAKRAAVIKSDGENFFRGGAEKTIAMVGGDPSRAPALIEYQLDAFADWLNRYAGDKEFKVPASMAMPAVLQEDPEDEE